MAAQTNLLASGTTSRHGTTTLRDLMHEAVMILAATVVIVVAFARLGLPAVLAYLLVGVGMGPHGAGLIHTTDLTDLLGEIGIAFLLFSIGLEFSFPRLWAMRGSLFGLGSVQVVAGTVSGAILAHWLVDIDWLGAMIAGGALALSSTAIVIKQLAEQAELDAPHGRLAVAILLFQDLAAVPFLVAIPILGHAELDTLATALALALIKGITVIAVMLAVGARLLPVLFHEVARHRNPEMMTLTVLLVALSAAAISHAVGLSLALGTFVAGMLLAESTFTRQIRHDIRPFRDILLGLFFISIGLSLDVPVVIAAAPWVVTLTVGVMLGKGLLIAGLARATGRPRRTSLRTGSVLGQGGEFGLALVILAVESGVIQADAASVVLAAITLSMFLAPSVIRYAERLIPAAPDPLVPPTSGTPPAGAEPVIVAGFGRTGQGLAQVLAELDLPCVGIERTAATVRDLAGRGPALIYGNAADPPVLEAAGIADARALVITFDDARETREVIHTARELAPRLPVIVRARDEATLAALRRAGAADGIPETLESSLMLSLQTLSVIGIPYPEADAAIRSVRAGRYPLIDRYEQTATTGATVTADTGTQRTLRLTLGGSAPWLGQAIRALPEDPFRRVLILTVQRADGAVLRPDPELELAPGDSLLLKGTGSDLDRAVRAAAGDDAPAL